MPRCDTDTYVPGAQARKQRREEPGQGASSGGPLPCRGPKGPKGEAFVVGPLLGQLRAVAVVEVRATGFFELKVLLLELGFLVFSFWWKV